jgi:hypothetical protein
MQGRLMVSLGMALVCSSMVATAALPPYTREALAEVETGARKAVRCSADYAVGSKKEISRFQILPSVWREYSKHDNYHDPNAAWVVAHKILRDREAEFRRATGRPWDGVDLYIMWNAPGVYRRAKWNRAHVSPVVRQRAERFAAVLERHQQRARDLARN